MSRLLSAMHQDLRYTLRSLTRAPGFALAVVLTIGLGIGAVTATYGVVYAVLLRPLPLRDQDQLVVLRSGDRGHPGKRLDIPLAAISRLAPETRTLTGLAAVHSVGASPFVFRDGDRVVALATTPVFNFFPVLGVAPAAGRLLEPEDDAPGAPPVLVLSYQAWRREFGGDPTVVGRALEFGRDHPMVIGVAPEGFEYPKGADAWIPMVYWESAPSPDPDGGFGSDLVGRMRDDITAEQVRAELSGFLREYPSKRLGDPASRVAVVQPLADDIVGDLRPGLLVLSAAVALVLVVVWINIAGLFLTRGLARAPELAIRTALGARPGRLVAQLMTEQLVLAALGGLVGIAVAVVLLRMGVTLAPPGLARFDEVRPDAGVLGFAVLVTIASVFSFGLAPALIVARRTLEATLRSGGSAPAGGSRSAGKARRLIVTGQVAVAFVVVVGAGLLGRTLTNLQRIDPGFQPERLLFVGLQLAAPASADSAELERVLVRWQTGVEGLQQRLRREPGIAGVTTTGTLPFSGAAAGGTRPELRYFLEGREVLDSARGPTADWEVAAESYFRTFGIPLRRGRVFTPEDRAGSQPVVVVSEAFARQAWSGQDPLGRQLRLGSPTSEGRIVVGMVGDTRFRDVAAPPRPTLYIPLRQSTGGPGAYLAVRTTSADPGRVLSAVRRALQETEPWGAIRRVAAGPDLLAQALARPRFLAAVLTALSTVVVLVAAVGLFGVLAALVRQRSNEFGIRQALGATGAQVRGLVLRQASLVLGSGLAVGFLFAVAVMRLLGAQLFGVSPTDPGTLLAAAIVLLVVTALAAYVPARRAARVDPMTALRSE